MRSQSNPLPRQIGNEVLFYSVKDTCRITSLGRTTIYSLLLDGTLKARKIGNRRLILAASVRELLNGEGKAMALKFGRRTPIKPSSISAYQSQRLRFAMPSKRINHCLIKIHRSYSIDEVASILDVHKNTVRGWIKSGLSIVDQSRPTLILGSELRRFMEARRNAAKRPCPPGTLYCLKCRQPMPPALGMVEYVALNNTTGNLIAFCRDCKTMMYRRARLATLHSKMPNLDVQIREAQPRLCERTPASLNCDKRKD